jgi:hypothetical protein
VNEWRLSNVMFVVYLLGEILAPIMPVKSAIILSHINTGFAKTYYNLRKILINGNGIININTDGYQPLFKVVNLKDF